MVGKVKVRPDAERRKDLKDLKGSGSGASGLTAVDEERAASMADEGGVSGPPVEGRPPKGDPAKSQGRRRGR
jgi:hypothetical protein